ncbi:MAG: tRNA (adenosine(37)-N6)-threonylcarbamoyltransferase complex dimerization subunit type 1 TsaB [Chlamydiales bacterium]
MTALLIETSTQDAAIALLEKKDLLTHVPLPGNKELSKLLIPGIQQLLRTGKKLDYIAVGIGPGSYTGTRVGVTVAQTLSFALKIPLIGFPSALVKEQDLAPAAAYAFAKWEKKEFEPIELVYEQRRSDER